MSYAIPDEPRPSPYNHLAVRPSGPLLAAMLCGSWLALPWFAFNSIAIGSPTRKRELSLCALSLAGAVVLGLVISAMWRGGLLESVTARRLVVLVVVTWKLTLAYWIYMVQSRTFGVYTYYGGTVRPATYVLACGYFIAKQLFAGLDSVFWTIILLGGV